MHTLTITGGSDDLIEIGGDWTDEIGWTAAADGETGYLAISDGTLLSVRYDDDGIWRLAVITKGSAELSKVDGIADDDTFDVVTLKASVPFKHVAFAEKVARA